MFSPYYYWSGRRQPDNHCALNVALYGTRANYWAMTERGRKAVEREPGAVVIGDSWMSWDDDCLTFWIDEVNVPWPTHPWPSRMRGKVRLHPLALTERRFTLDGAGRHRWWPVAPCSRIEVELEQPALSWTGSGYFDSNDGDEPLEAGFAHWDWSRASLGQGGEAALLYDLTDRRGRQTSLALHTDATGRVTELEPPSPVALPRTFWRMQRGTRADSDGASVTATFEDTPFYSRSLLSTHILGQNTFAMHETLSLDRFRSPVVKLMLPYRMPRRF